MSNATDTRTEIVHHMAMAYYESAYMDWREATHGEVDDNGHGVDPACVWAAFDLANDLEKQHGMHLSELFTKAVEIAGPDGGDRPQTTEYFGHYCAMENMGHGVGLWDALGSDACDFVKIPYGEFSYHEMDHLRFPSPPED